MKVALFLGACAGLALFAFLLMRQGLGEIAGFVAAAGWGMLLVPAFHLAPMTADTLGWWKLFPSGRRPRFRQLLWMRWLGESVNNLLPAAQVGGDVLRARLVMLGGVSGPVAGASVVAQLTVGVFTQAAFTLLGVGLLAARRGGEGLLAPIAGSLVIAVVLFGGFYAVQRFGMFRLLAKLASRLRESDAWKSILENGSAFDTEVRAVYQRKRDLAMSGAWTMLGWVVGAGEIWIALWVLGVPATFAEAVILESLSQAVKGVMFLVPGALGFQEGGFIVIGAALGIPAPMALALSLVRRFRDIAMGVPGLLIWQWIEGRRLWNRRGATAET
ncbi:MAG: flippase-like domain-containing protein [Verrucomicrobia bacterium]|nr:flippase-like domain-containing protein [Verrucomicrobiota bacterium]